MNSCSENYSKAKKFKKQQFEHRKIKMNKNKIYIYSQKNNSIKRETEEGRGEK